MLHPLRALRRTTGLWLARAVVTELKGVRAELAALRQELAHHSPGPGVQISVGQGFLTARPAPEAPDPAFHQEDLQAIEATTEQRYVEYAQIASELHALYRRTPTTEEIEREHLLRLGN